MPVKSEPVLEDGNIKGRPLWKDALLRRLQKSVHFVKTMTPSNVGGKTTMVIPAGFVNKHSHLFGKTICLQSEVLSVTKPWVVRLSICKRATKQSPEVLFCRAGWRDFAVGHGLAEGDDLLFSLRAVSKFDVYVFRKPAPPRKRPRGFDEEVALSKPGDCSPGHSDEGVSKTKKRNLGENIGPIFAFRGRTKVQRCAATYHLHYLDSRDLQEPPCLRADVSQDRLESPIRERENDGNPKAVTEKAESKKNT